MKQRNEAIRRLVSEAAVYMTPDAMYSVDCHLEEEQAFMVTDEDTGDEHQIGYDDVNLNTDVFYKLQRLESCL